MFKWWFTINSKNNNKMMVLRINHKANQTKPNKQIKHPKILNRTRLNNERREILKYKFKYRLQIKTMKQFQRKK